MMKLKAVLGAEQGLNSLPGSDSAFDTSSILPSPYPLAFGSPAQVPAPPLNAGQEQIVEWETGLKTDGSVTSRSYWDQTSGTAVSWSWGTGATVTVGFDAGSNWSLAEENAWLQGLAIWSGVANVHFQLVSDATTAEVELARYHSGAVVQGETLAAGSSYEETTASEYVDPGRTMVRDLKALISLDVPSSGFGDIASYDFVSGYGISTLVHELGHLMGLGHAGQYNGTVDPGTDQKNAYDVRTWSTMSYIQPEDTDARYYDQYNPAGTDWFTAFDSYYRAPYTPMALDIVGAQRLYGVSDSATFSGGQVFGFNSNVTYITATNSVETIAQYDFTKDTIPVVTLFDSGLDNTLDVSGWSSHSLINLNPGTFSSTNSLTNNICIAFNTRIDGAVGGGGNDRFIVNADADTINGGSGSDTVVFDLDAASYTALRQSNGTVTVTRAGVTDTLTNIETLQFSDQSISTNSLPCFVTGTRIATLRGEVAVEALRPGDQVLLARGGTAPATWIGHRTLDCSRHPRPHDVRPVRISAHAFGRGKPYADLLLSPDHAVYADGVLIPVRYLINGATIVQEAAARQAAGRVGYWHVELAGHAVILAQGLPAESYLDTGNRGAFANGGSPLDLHPDFALRVWERQSCAPLVCDGASLEAVRSFLLAEAASLGWSLTREPAFALEVNAHRIAPVRRGDRLCFTVPHDTATARLVSRSFVPSETFADSADCRVLGVAVSGLWLDGAAVPLASPLLGEGWLEPEAAFRWTTGAGAIALGGARRVDISIGLTGRYWQRPRIGQAVHASA